MNIAAYIIYLAVTYCITVLVGKQFYNNGFAYIKQLFPSDIELGTTINKLLLLAYYLVNIGYATLLICTWKKIDTIAQLIANIATYVGIITVSLAVLHYCNMAVLYFIAMHQTRLFHHLKYFHNEK